MAGRPSPDATNKSSHMRCPWLCNGFARLGLESCQKIGTAGPQNRSAAWPIRPLSAIRTGRCSDVGRSFENNSDMVATPPCQLAHGDGLKIVEGDEKIYRKKPESIGIHSGGLLVDVVSDARLNPSSPAEEQQTTR
jgi:hypothetical protein